MSRFFEKIKSGEMPTDEDWSDHLIEAHKIAPSMTPNGFSAFKSDKGLNSYELLAETIECPLSGKATIVDLACGDGHLIPYLLKKVDENSRIYGVDMSEGELSVARALIKDARVTFKKAKAQNLPLPDQSADHVVCHMAFMLMLPIEPVVQEISRVLKPDGTFSAVVGSRLSTDLWAEIQKLTFQFIDSKYPKIRETRSGDPRVGTLEGLRELFKPVLGFGEPSAPLEFSLNMKVTPEGIWNFMKDMYFVGMLPEPEKVELKTALVSLGKDNMGAEGKVSFQFPMKIFTTEKILRNDRA